MKWTVLTDNRTQNPLLQTEHGLSILLETEKHRLLLDTGASDVFICNAEKLGIDLSTVDYVFISHGHGDHAGGLKHFMEINDGCLSPDAVLHQPLHGRFCLCHLTSSDGRKDKSFFLRNKGGVRDVDNIVEGTNNK